MRKLQNLIPDFSKKLLLKAAAAASVLFLSTAFPAFPSLAASAYDNLAVANVTSEPLNMRTKPSTDGEIVGKCYRGAGGTVLEKKDGWTKVRSGKIEGWMSDKYLLFGAVSKRARSLIRKDHRNDLKCPRDPNHRFRNLKTGG